MNILVLTDVLPAPVLSGKKHENDVLLTTAVFHEKQQADVKYTFVFVTSYSNLLLSFVSRKWKELYQFKLLRKYEMRGRVITILPVPNFQEDGPFKALFIKIGYYMNKRKLRQLLERHHIDLVHAHDIKLNAGLAYHIYKEHGIPYVVTTRKLGKLKFGRTLVKYLQHAKSVINLGFSQQAIAEKYHANSTIIPHGVDDRFLKQQKVYAQQSSNEEQKERTEALQRKQTIPGEERQSTELQKNLQGKQLAPGKEKQSEKQQLPQQQSEGAENLTGKPRVKKQEQQIAYSKHREAAPLKIVSLCRLLKWKNIDKVFLALEQLDGDFIYDIYGEGPDQARLQNILSTLKIRDKVHFKGYLAYQEVPETLVRYDLFVLPSFREMFGRVYIEAMACGLPVIGAKNCGIDGYIENGVQGFLVNHQDVDEIAAAIRSL